MFTALWIALFVMILIVEALALRDKRKGDTLSEHVWLLRTKRVGRALFMPLWAWLTWHFWLEPASVGPQRNVWWDDLLIVGVVFAIALLANLYEEEA